VVTVALGTTIFLVGRGRVSKTASTPVGDGNVVVTTQNITGYNFFDGDLLVSQADQRTVFSDSDAIIRDVLVHKGMVVKRGDPLFRLDIYSHSKVNSRLLRTQDDGSGFVRAPISGLVTAVYARPGLAGAPKLALGKIVNFERVTVKGYVPTALKSELVVGARVVVSFANPSSDTLEGVLTKVMVKVEPKGVAIPKSVVDMNIVKYSGVGLLPIVNRIGSKIESVQQALAVPVEAITTSNGNSTVQIKLGTQWKDRTVVTGISDGTMVEIKSGVPLGTVVRLHK
jgi:multidrug efflux pump subunit AcrA (membrane-fusion protein)